jgi:aminoglycoside phosphotransferase (APT) family kinase protein
MTEDAALARIASDLGLTIVRPFAGGVWGATLVTGTSGEQFVLKTVPTQMWPKVFARGASLANRLRAQGYPAPEYLETGAAHGATWSLQRVLPGGIPDVTGESHMRQLLALAERHAGAVPEGGGDWLAHQVPFLSMSLRTITDAEATRVLAVELGAVLERTKSVVLFDDGVVHNDFHHRNFLAIGDDVTGVFDWEFADVGDWRYDLVTLAFWSVLMPEQIPPPVAKLVVERMREACPPDVHALFAAVRTISQLDFDIRNNPDFLPGLIAGIETNVAPWWRTTA